ERPAPTRAPADQALYPSGAPPAPAWSYGERPRPTPDQLAEEEEPAPPFVDLALSAQAPLSLGAMAGLELPARLLVELEVGWMPPAFGSAIGGLVQSFGGFDSTIGQLVDEAFDDAVVVRASGGWRPFSSAGFFLFGGYTYVGLSGSITPAKIASVAGDSFASQVAAQVITQDVNVSSQLHNFHVGLGWRWVVWDHLVIRASLAYMQTLGSSSSVETPQAPAVGNAATPIVDEELSAIYGTYVKLPVIGLAAGYRF
ncbi:MAG: hypothetical protein KC731_28745, partial [Myxococcales bacterium]|nr:hypothetical protein [Myxococcales bacterium]